MREKTIKEIEKNKIIVIVRNVEKNKLIPLAEAMFEGGIRLLEVTYDATGKVSDSETAERIKMLADHFEGRMLIGAGTVLNAVQVEATQKAGGKFIISPNINPEVIKKTVELDMVSMPGALTPTEIEYAHALGADFVKVFPAGDLGPGYIKAVKAPLSHIKLTAVGGINEKNLTDYMKAGVSGFGVGTNIVDKKMLAEDDYKRITEKAKQYIDAVKSF